MQSLLPASGVLYEITSMVRVEVKFIGSDRIGRYIATGKIGIGISVKWRIGATLYNTVSGVQCPIRVITDSAFY